MIGTHAFNAAFAASQLAARIESGPVSMSEKIAAAAVGMADAEAEGIDWGKVNYDSVCDAVAMSTELYQIHSDAELDEFRRYIAKIVKGKARRVA